MIIIIQLFYKNILVPTDVTLLLTNHDRVRENGYFVSSIFQLFYQILRQRGKWIEFDFDDINGIPG
jgi:hypothetical protein